MPLYKITVEMVVDTDDPDSVYDGLNDGFYALMGNDEGLLVDWAYPGLHGSPGEPTPVGIPREEYQEGDAWRK